MGQLLRGHDLAGTSDEVAGDERRAGAEEGDEEWVVCAPRHRPAARLTLRGPEGCHPPVRRGCRSIGSSRPRIPGYEPTARQPCRRLGAGTPPSSTSPAAPMSSHDPRPVRRPSSLRVRRRGQQRQSPGRRVAGGNAVPLRRTRHDVRRPASRATSRYDTLATDCPVARRRHRREPTTNQQRPDHFDLQKVVFGASLVHADAHQQACTARIVGQSYATWEYSLISPLRIFLRRTRVAVRSATGRGGTLVALGGCWPRAWCGRWSL